MALRLVGRPEQASPADPVEVLDELRDAHLRAANLLAGDHPWRAACIGIAQDLSEQIGIEKEAV